MKIDARIETAEEVLKIIEKSEERPYLNYKTIKFLEKILTKNFEVLETGSGCSTIWFAKKVKSVISYESKREWEKAVNCRLEERGLDNVTIYYDSKYSEKEFSELGDKRFDVILADGSDAHGHRVMCMMKLSKFLKIGGHLVVDDTHRKIYKKGIDYLNSLGWETIELAPPDRFGSVKEAIAWRRLA